jgi:hypothetical protein
MDRPPVIIHLEPRQSAGWLAFVLVSGTLLAGCAKQETASTAPVPVVPPPPVVEPAPLPAPVEETKPALTVVREYKETLAGSKRSVKLVVRGDEDPVAVEKLLRDYVDANRQEDEEMWVAVFFEGMDLQSIEYAFAVAKPGRKPYVTVRESLQTYR